jgi:uncharacterized protein YcgI (DUF1989 family)
VLYSDVARPMFTIVADTCGRHDTIGGCCSAPSNFLMYGVTDVPGCRETFLRLLRRYGLGRRDIVANLNFFSNVPVGPEGKLADTVSSMASPRRVTLSTCGPRWMPSPSSRTAPRSTTRVPASIRRPSGW